MNRTDWILVDGVAAATGSALTRLVAEALAEDFGERVLLIAPDLEESVHSETLTRAPLPQADDLVHAVQKLAAEQGSTEFHRVFIDPGSVENHAQLLPEVGHLVHCAHDTFAALPSEVPPGCQISFVSQSKPSHARYEPHLLRAGTCRAHLPLHRLAGKARREQLEPAERNFIDRLARTVSGRRVGVALGGGGAWGFGHIALMEGLVEAGVPIDVVSGVSFGAIVGAFYASGGLPALDRMVRERYALMFAVGASSVHSRALEAYVDQRVPQQWLEHLPLPFVPVATHVDTGEPDALRVGSVGRAVRASGSLPGLLGPTIIGGTRYVDGGISCNVPANLLPAEGAGLVIASNVMQRPTATRSPRTAPLARLATEMNPIERAKDLILSMSTLTHNGGALTAVNAHVTYQAHNSAFSPWDFHKGQAIREEARRDVVETVTRVQHAWAALSRPGAGR